MKNVSMINGLLLSVVLVVSPLCAETLTEQGVRHINTGKEAVKSGITKAGEYATAGTEAFVSGCKSGYAKTGELSAAALEKTGQAWASTKDVASNTYQAVSAQVSPVVAKIAKRFDGAKEAIVKFVNGNKEISTVVAIAAVALIAKLSYDKYFAKKPAKA